MRLIKFVFDRLFAALTWFALSLLVIMAILIFANVFCRYLLHFSIAWAEEVSLIFLIWFVFIALAIGVRKKIHISIDFLSFFLPKKFLDNVVQRIVDLLTVCFGGLLIYFGIELIKIGSYSTLASMDIPSYVEYVFIPVSGGLVMYSALIDCFRNKSAEPEEDYLDTVFMKKVERHV